MATDITNFDECSQYCIETECEECVLKKRYVNYSCKHYTSRVSKLATSLIGEPNKICITCKNFADKSCLILQKDREFFKRLLYSFGIKLRIPNEDGKLYLSEG